MLERATTSRNSVGGKGVRIPLQTNVHFTDYKVCFYCQFNIRLAHVSEVRREAGTVTFLHWIPRA